MFDLILLLIALLGSTIAAAYDLKTTEVPDWVFYFMFAFGLPIIIVQSFLSNDISPLFNSTIAGLSLLAFGFFMYKFGQWGGADVFILALIIFLVPTVPKNFSPNIIFPFPMSMLVNVFLLGAVYMIIYAVIIAIKNKKIIDIFSKDLKASSKIISFASITLFFIFFAVSLYIAQIFSLKFDYYDVIKNSLLILFLTVGFFVVYKFARVVENVGFKRRIPVSKLRVGDMLLETRELVGIDKKQLMKIRKSEKKFVWIKEGVRFAPVFPLALLFTLYVGDAILLIRFLI